mgnify:CR=1 FL=1
MTPNQSTNENSIDINALLESFSVITSNQDVEKNQTDLNNAVSSILLEAAYEPIPAKAADAVPGLEIFEDGDNPGSWFWEWEWGECQDGPYPNELEALIAFAKFSAEFAIELAGNEDDDD